MRPLIGVSFFGYIINMYTTLIIDTLNFAYQVFKKEHEETVMLVNNKAVYPAFIREMVETIQYFQVTHCEPTCQVFLLYDNPTSRDKIRQMFIPLSPTSSRKKVNESYKANRRRERQEFYNSVDLFRLYYMVGEPRFHSVRITNLEADDLVPSCISYIQDLNLPTQTLLVSTDSDWCKYLNASTHILVDWYDTPITVESFEQRRGFKPTEESIILSKILEGDSADNVPAVLKPDLDPTQREQLLMSFSSIAEIYEVLADDDGQIAPDIVVVLLRKEKEVQSIYQMLATIPVSKKQFIYNCVHGRNSTAQRNWLDSILFGTQQPEEIQFSFDTLKIPRKDPQ